MKDCEKTIFCLHDAPLLPEQRLCHAILWRALKDLFSTKEDRKRALGFILSRKCKSTHWSFRWLCFCIDLDPENIINHVNEYRDKLNESYLRDLLDHR